MGSITFEPQVLNLMEVITDNLTLHENPMREKQIKPNVDIPGDSFVFADKNMLNTVIRNLISNAVKFCDKGEIFVKVIDGNGQYTVSITDTGVGMSEEKASSIFEISKSKTTEGTRGEPGTGLGLIICKEFVEKIGGTIGVKSEPGKGSTFYFSVPKNSK